MDIRPKPGSDGALMIGCKCSSLLNNYGKGYNYTSKVKDDSTLFIINTKCPIHNPSWPETKH